MVLRMRYPLSHRMEDQAAAILLAYDILQLGGLLYLTGGLENPFAFLFLAPVMISATTLPPHRTVALGAIAMTVATILAFWHQPLPWNVDDSIRLPPLYVAGVWLSILLGLTFIGLYAWRVSEEARQLSDALAATELVLAREQHLTQLDGLAAAAAHELGTPLATIALVARELDRAMPEDDPHKDDIRLLNEQSARCRAILGKLASLGTDPAGPLGELSLRQLLEEVTAPHRAFGVTLNVAIEGTGAEPGCRRNPGLLYGLGNLVENAVDFAETAVAVVARHDERSVTITIRDDGPGFPQELLGRLGEPYLTRRGGDRPARDGGGLGLGMFIAKTLLERSGAVVEARNAVLPDSGASITVTWPRQLFQRAEAMPDRAPMSHFP
jgi:two-component system sensor histidine kinase RegB